MKNNESINNINSIHILNDIFNYIGDKNFKDKLFLYSKKWQKKLDIKLIGLKENYLKKIKFDLDKYLYIEPGSFIKDILSKEYNKFFLEKKLSKERIENIILDIYENKEIKDIEEEDVDKIKNREKLINIESPLFQMLSKIKNFGKLFTIHISQRIIDENELKDEYIELFEKLNILNIKYESIFYNLADINKINYLKEINIDFNKIKRLTIKTNYEDKDDDDEEDEDEDKDEDEDEDEVKDNNKKQINNFFEILFSINNIKNNLIYLNIKFNYCKINPELFENINNFKLLRYLYLKNINFDKDFIIKIKKLKLLSIISYKNIKLSGMPNEELNIFYLRLNKISNINILEKESFKDLNTLDLSFNNLSDINILGKVNFKELKKLYLRFNQISDINILEKVNCKGLNILDLSHNNLPDIDILEEVNFQELKELNLEFNKISDIDILEKVNFKEIKELNLKFNRISDIDILEKVNFKELNILDLSCNQISDINILEKINFKKLNILYLRSNKISDINILEKVNFKDLNLLDLRSNKISDINVLEKVNFKDLNILDLSSNNISDISILGKVTFKDLIELDLRFNPISDTNILEILIAKNMI